MLEDVVQTSDQTCSCKLHPWNTEYCKLDLSRSFLYSLLAPVLLPSCDSFSRAFACRTCILQYAPGDVWQSHHKIFLKYVQSFEKNVQYCTKPSGSKHIYKNRTKKKDAWQGLQPILSTFGDSLCSTSSL